MTEVQQQGQETMAEEPNRSPLQAEAEAAAADLMMLAADQAEELLSLSIPARRRSAASASASTMRIHVESRNRLLLADRALAERDMLEERYLLEEMLAFGESDFSDDDMYFDSMMPADRFLFDDEIDDSDSDDEREEAEGRGNDNIGVVSGERRATRRCIPAPQLSDRVSRRYRVRHRIVGVERTRRKRAQNLQRQRQLEEHERQKMLEFHIQHSQPFDDHRHLFIRRVVAGIGWAVHSLVFELGPKSNSRRWGYNLDNNGKELSLNNNDLASRGARCWVTIKPGDYIVKVEGHQSTSGKFLCSGICLHLASGNEIKLESTHVPWRGPAFSFDVAPNETAMLRGLDFGIQRCNGLCQGVFLQRTSIHTPFCKRTLKFLPQRVQDAVTIFQLCANRAGLSSDIAWNILEMLPPIEFC